MSYRVKARFDEVSVTITTDSDNPLDLDDIAAVASRQLVDLNAALTEPTAPTLAALTTPGMSHREAMIHDYLLGDE